MTVIPCDRKTEQSKLDSVICRGSTTRSTVSGTQTNFANGLLGYGDKSRLLIVNADDFGMSKSVNEAVRGAIKAGVVRSTSLMVPGPAAPAAMRMLREDAAIRFGIHLTVVCEVPGDRWGPIASREKVLSLVDGWVILRTGPQRGLCSRCPTERARVGVHGSERRSRIPGLQPSYLDWHCLANGGRADIFS